MDMVWAKFSVLSRPFDTLRSKDTEILQTELV